ncbi:MAG: zeta toxin family protein [Thermomicrobiales bacterium]
MTGPQEARSTRSVLIIVGGAPGAGKTRLSRALGERMNWPVIARDDLKEVLLNAFPPTDRTESMRLGGPSWGLMYAVLDRLIDRVPGIVIEANFRAGRSEVELRPRAERCATPSTSTASPAGRRSRRA